MTVSRATDRQSHVSPLRGEWIEMQLLAQLADSAEVSPLRGERIEIY